jgi:hypothetical protein
MNWELNEQIPLEPEQRKGRNQPGKKSRGVRKAIAVDLSHGTRISEGRFQWLSIGDEGTED